MSIRERQEVEALDKLEEENGWTVLATTVSAAVCTDAEILQAYQEQHTTVEPGCRWIKTPAAIAPVWLEKPERIAALAMLTVLGLLVDSVIQRQVRLYLLTHDQQLPGNKGPTALPTARMAKKLEFLQKRRFCYRVLVQKPGTAQGWKAKVASLQR